jgi:peptidoglycan hydrolase-like protein with peptidoglycan-binding domain
MESLAYIHIADQENHNLEFISPINLDIIPKITNIYWLFILLPFISLTFTNNAWAIWLNKGSQTEQVKIIQQALKKAGYFQAPITGYYGDITKEAVRKFQLDKNIDPTGIVGPTTMNVMKNLGYISNSNINSKNSQNNPPFRAITKKKNDSEQNNQSSRIEICSSSDDVAEIQTKLRKLGYFRGPSTGFFGRVTETAVKKFQQDYNLEVDGVVGPQTLATLNKNLNAKK